VKPKSRNTPEKATSKNTPQKVSSQDTPQKVVMLSPGPSPGTFAAHQRAILCWERFWSSRFECPYWVNEFSGEVVWTLPGAEEAAPEVLDSETAEGHRTSCSSQQNNSTPEKSTNRSTPQKDNVRSTPVKTTSTADPEKAKSKNTPRKALSTESPGKASLSSVLDAVAAEGHRTSCSSQQSNSTPEKSTSRSTPQKANARSTPVKATSKATPEKAKSKSTPQKAMSTESPGKEAAMFSPGNAVHQQEILRWERFWHDKYQCPYWVNAFSGEVVWTLPGAEEAAPEAAAAPEAVLANEDAAVDEAIAGKVLFAVAAEGHRTSCVSQQSKHSPEKSTSRSVPEKANVRSVPEKANVRSVPEKANVRSTPVKPKSKNTSHKAKSKTTPQMAMSTESSWKDADEHRRNPYDGRVYTFAMLLKACSMRHSAAACLAYWEENMLPLRLGERAEPLWTEEVPSWTLTSRSIPEKGNVRGSPVKPKSKNTSQKVRSKDAAPKDADEYRRSPYDGRLYNFASLVKACSARHSTAECSVYWEEEMLPLRPGERAEPVWTEEVLFPVAAEGHRTSTFSQQSKNSPEKSMSRSIPEKANVRSTPVKPKNKNTYHKAKSKNTPQKAMSKESPGKATLFSPGKLVQQQEILCWDRFWNDKYQCPYWVNSFSGEVVWSLPCAEGGVPKAAPGTAPGAAPETAAAAALEAIVVRKDAAIGKTVAGEVPIYWRPIVHAPLPPRGLVDDAPDWARLGA